MQLRQWIISVGIVVFFFGLLYAGLTYNSFLLGVIFIVVLCLALILTLAAIVKLLLFGDTFK